MIYKPEYQNSRALIIGINQYQFVNPLSYACNDAEAIAQTLENNFDFSNDKITQILDEDATKENILSRFHEFSQDGTDPDDKLLIFFAGHGHTEIGNRGEVGFLVPVDGKTDNIATLIRWDEFTRNAELIKAKHILFIMDACYGGLAVSRAPSGGSMRFLKDMCQRYSRQVLTAGKANETVSDAGRPVPDHSVFTGHILQGLQGNAVMGDNIITANSVMSYVYDKVAKDPHSRQTPHFGFIEGDGDFIFKADILSDLSKSEKEDKDVLIQIPSTTDNVISQNQDITELFKEYVSDPKYKIKLHDTISQEIRKANYLLSEDNFPLHDRDFSPENISNRIKKYESLNSNLQSIITILCHWGNREHIPIIQKIISRLSDNNGLKSGVNIWLNMQWYPISILLYSGGISSFANKNYENLYALMYSSALSPHSSNKLEKVIIPASESLAECNDAFKKLPDYEKKYVPISEYIFKKIQPTMENLLFLGTSYESLFDHYEIYQMLAYADLTDSDCGYFGRFGWKHVSRSYKNGVYTEFIDDAMKYGNDWLPLKAGFFRSDINRFKEIADRMLERLNNLQWF